MFARTGLRTGSLSGEGTDPSGAVVPGARILVFGDRRSGTFSTDETGRFLLSGLKPGTYEVSVITDGFAPFADGNNQESSSESINFATGLVRGNPVATEATERGVDPAKLIDAVAKKLAPRGGDAPLESTMQAMVWQATKP